MVNEEMVAWAVLLFDTYKSPEPNGIFSALLQRSLPVILPCLDVISRTSFEVGFIPKESREKERERAREVRILFIPKAVKTNHNTAKDWRPISLKSFFEK